jgi:hypothetical protein
VEYAVRLDRRPDPDGDTKLAVDQPSLLFASYHNPDIETVGRRLDYLLALLIPPWAQTFPQNCARRHRDRAVNKSKEP